ncbi:MAG TPA: phosphohydrolase [Spirochaetaceae bacterium]|nr:phosphohydrolase [Spirochaetaceae bacterium]
MSEISLLNALVHRFDVVVRDPVWGDVHMDAPLHALFQSKSFMVLDRIRQLGPVALVYPGATHTRKAHSLGVYYIARRMALALVEKGEIDFVSKTGLRSFLVAALCHDIGHFPYAHSLKDLPLSRHEALAGEMIVSEPLRQYVSSCGADPEQTAAIIDPDRSAGESRETLLFRSFLSGVLDPDKIDYLTRDAFYCGVPYGIQDADYIMRRLVVHDDRLAIDLKGEMSIEALIFAKYQMYRAVYWHPTVRAATAMVRKAVYLGLAEGVLQPNSLYGLDDTSFGRLMNHSKFAPFKLAREAEEKHIFRLVDEHAFDEENPVHADLLDIGKRIDAESTLAQAAELPETDVVIDIPERIKLETDLMVKIDDHFEAFDQRSTLFQPETVAKVAGALRTIRVYLRPQSNPDLKKIQALVQALLG